MTPPRTTEPFGGCSAPTSFRSLSVRGFPILRGSLGRGDLPALRDWAIEAFSGSRDAKMAGMGDIPTPGAFPAGGVNPTIDPRVVKHRNFRYARAQRFALPTSTDHLGQVSDPEPRYACPQEISPEGDLVQTYRALTLTEDCHVLSVTVPSDLAPGEQVPVMVWIHGGSYQNGAGELPLYEPDALVAEGRIAVVTVTYRLGPFGFVGGGTRPANLGLHDLTAALRWVRAHIAQFGGDPEQVTIAGQSSGADAVIHLMIASGTQGLFRRAIVQSAPFGVRGRRRGLERALARALDKSGPGATPEEILATRRRLPITALRFGLRLGMPYAPTYGAAPLPAESDASRAWRERTRDLKVLVGWTRDEAAFFLGSGPGFLRRWLWHSTLGSGVRTRIVDRLTDVIYRRGAKRFARLIGSSARATYEVRWAPGLGGAMHAIELPLLFPSATAWRGMTMIGDFPPERLLEEGKPLRAAWAGFVRGEGAPAADIDLAGGGSIAVWAEPTPT